MRGTKRKRVLNRVIIRLNKFPSKVKTKKKKKLRFELKFDFEWKKHFRGKNSSYVFFDVRGKLALRILETFIIYGTVNNTKRYVDCLN